MTLLLLCLNKGTKREDCAKEIEEAKASNTLVEYKNEGMFCW